MKNLNSIPNLGRWSEIAQLLNENLQKIENELVSLGLSTYKGKGYFESEGALTKLYPNPQQGDWAIVDGSIYQASLDDNGYYWEDTEKDLSINVDLNEYVKEEIFSAEVAKKLSSGMILPFEGVLEKIDDSELVSGGFVTGTPYSIYYVKDKDCFLAYYNRIFNSAIYDNGVDLMPKYNDSETGKSLKNNLYIDADGNIFAFENENLKKTISAKTKYTNHAKVNKVLKELFIQKADEELNPSDYYVSVIFKKKYQGDNAQSMCQFQIRSINTNDTVCQYTDYIEDVEHEPNKLIELKESNDSGISGHAIINWNDFTENIFYYHYYSEGKAFLTNLCLDISFSPTIYSYVNKAKTDSKIKEADERLSEEIETLDEQKAGKEGTYPNLTSGFADNLVGRGEATSEVFTFRQSGGNTSINDGTARLKSIKGNSVVFNQLFLRGANSNYYQWEDSKVTINGTITSDYETYDTEGNGAIYSLANDHILLVTIKQLSGKVTNGEVQIRAASFGANKILTITPESSNAELSFIGKYLSSGKYYTRTKILANTTVDNLVLQYQIFDLTAMFGAGNEPQTVEEFRELYPNDYYEYNTGEIINSNYTAIESVGFNAFDGELEVGAYSNTTGLPLENDTYSRSKNYIEVLSGEKYYFYAKTGISYIRVRCYDSNYNFISYIGAPYSPNSDNSPNYNNPITIPNGASYITFDTNRTLDIAQNLDICLNLVHTGYRNGQYEPYRKDVINLPNIELKKAGNVYDEVRYNPNSEKWEYVQRVGSVDMGELNWVYYTNPNTTTYPYGYLTALVAGRQKGAYNILCSRYTYSGGFTVDNNIFGNDAFVSVYAIDSNYTDGQVFKEAMKGQILQYELAEPIITELEGDYSTDYIVSDFGTEKAITDKLCAPFSADIIYQFNAVDRIRENSAKIKENTQAIATKQDALTLTVKDNGNIVIGNIQGQTKEFMPATPSGDPNHYMYEKCGAVWNGNTGYWELNGLTDLTNEDMQECYSVGNVYMNPITSAYQYASKKFRTNMWVNQYFDGNYSAPFNSVFRNNSKLEVINLKGNNTEYIVYGLTSNGNIDYCFRNCDSFRRMIGIVKIKGKSLTNAFFGCRKLEEIYINGVNTNVSFADSPNLSSESLLYLINNAGTASFTITLHADTYAWASVDKDIRAALAIKTNIKLESA